MFGNDELNTEGTRSAKRSLDYLNRAQCAQQEGDDSLAASLYLAAFDCAQKEGENSKDFLHKVLSMLFEFINYSDCSENRI